MASMDMRGWSYRYVGPDDLRALVRAGGEGWRMRSPADFGARAARLTAEELGEPFTYVVDADGILCLAPRRSEHWAGGFSRSAVGWRELGR